MKKVARAAVLMAGSSALGVAINFAIQVYLAYRFGAGTDMDAYVAAMTLPALFTAVFIPGVSMVLIPVFVESMHKHGRDRAWRTASSLLNAGSLGLVVLLGLTAGFAGPLMHRIVPGLNPGTMSLAVSLTRWLLPATILTIIAGTLTGLYQAQEIFWPTAISPVLGSALLLTVAVVLVPTQGIRAIAIATVVGNLAQMLTLLPVLRGSYVPALNLRDADLRRIGLLLAPLAVGGLVFRATIVADRLVASLLPQGSLSHLEYASKIAAVIIAVFTSGVAAALFPRMSAHAAAGDGVKLYDTLVWGQRLLMLFLFPALAIGWVLRMPLLEIVLQRGQFTYEDTQAVAAIVSWFMLGVVGAALGILQGRVYYVLQDTMTPVLLGVVETAVYVAYLPLLASHYGAVGVGMANAIYLISALGINEAIVLRRLPAHRVSDLLLSAARLALFAAMAGVSTWLVAVSVHGTVTVLVAGTVCGAGTYYLLLQLTRAREIRALRSLLLPSGEDDAT